VTERASPHTVESLDAILTSACNLRCAYCYQNAKKPSRMTWETLRSCIDFLLASEREEVTLTFYGGEPLLEFPMIRHAVAYAEASKPRRLSLRYAIITNGTLLGDAATEFLAAHRFDTRLSFDGVPLAQRLRGRGTFRLLDGLLGRVRRDHPSFFRDNFAVNVVVYSANLEHLADSIDYFLEQGVNTILVSPSVIHDSGWHKDDIERLNWQFARVFRSSLSFYRRTGRIPLVRFRKSGIVMVRDPTGLGLCGVGRGDSLAVAPDGESYGCVMLSDAYQAVPPDSLLSRLSLLKMGNLRASSFPTRYARYPATARTAEIFDNRHLKHSSYGRCDRCRFAVSCTVCPVSIGYVPDNKDPHRIPDAACAFNLVALEHRERFPTPTGAHEFLTGRAFIPGELRELRSYARARHPLTTRSSR
jgi:sulfatase maturation enzyme AslB (radical SAM superfamily)